MKLRETESGLGAKYMKKQGLTLIEVLIAIAILGFLITGIIAYNLMGEKFYQSTVKGTQVVNEASSLVQMIGRDVREAENVTFDGRFLRIYIPREGGARTEVIVYTYDQGAKKIYYSNPSKGIENQLLASNVSQFDVSTDMVNKKVTIGLRLKIEKRDTKLKEESYYVSTFHLRN